MWLISLPGFACTLFVSVQVSQEHSTEFRSSTQKFGDMLSEAVSTINGGVELELPDERFVQQYDLKHINSAKDDPLALDEMERCITEWCRVTEDLLAQVSALRRIWA